MEVYDITPINGGRMMGVDGDWEAFEGVVMSGLLREGVVHPVYILIGLLRGLHWVLSLFHQLLPSKLEWCVNLISEPKNIFGIIRDFLGWVWRPDMSELLAVVMSSTNTLNNVSYSTTKTSGHISPICTSRGSSIEKLGYGKTIKPI
jgi:hypothetical protein